MRWVLVGLLLSGAVFAEPPEMALCASFLRDGERARAEAKLGPLFGLPLYRAELSIDPGARTVKGQVSLRYPARHATSALYLRLTPNVFHPGAVRLGAIRQGDAPVAQERVSPGLLRIALAQKVEQGGVVELRFQLVAKVPAAEADAPLAAMLPSATKTDHGAFAAHPDFLSLVGVLPQVPPEERDGRPTLGPTGVGDLALYEPGNYLVTATVPRGWRVLAIGNALGEVPQPDRSVRFSFDAAAVRDYPLFAARGYARATSALGDLTLESDFSPGDEKTGREVLARAVAAVKLLQARLGPLPGRTLRLVEAPLTGGAGGMEFPGLVTIGQMLYRGGPLGGLGGLGALSSMQGASGLLGAADFGPMLSRVLELSVDHELAHQYFAGLVGSDPVKDPVADESLAQYVALLLIRWQDGEPAYAQMRQEQLVTAYQLYRLLGGRDGPADRPTSDFDNELEYAALVYGKAPLLHEAEAKLLGEAAFVDGLAAYVRQYRDGWADGDSLTRTLAALHPEKRKALFALRRHWLEESHGDEDLGAPNLGAMVKQLTGAELDPQSEQLLEQLLPQLMGH